MMPYLIKIGSFEIRFYSIMIVLALIIAIYMAKKRAKDFGISSTTIENIVIVTFIFSIIGARIYYVALKWDYYSLNPFEILAIWHGGLAIHGGVIFGTLACVIYSWRLKLKAMFTVDLIAPWLLFGQGLGRFGNFANGEAHGVPTITPPEIIFTAKPIFLNFWNTILNKYSLDNTPASISTLGEIIKSPTFATINFEGKEYLLKEYIPWGISFTEKYMPAAYLDFGNLPIHPTFFYEMILNFIGATILYLFWKKDRWISSGVIFGLYLIFYGFIRAFVTFFRADDLMIGLLRAPHIASLVFIIIGVFFLIRGLKIKNNSIYKKSTN